MSNEGDYGEAVPPSRRRVLIRPRLWDVLEAFCRDRESDAASEVNRALREMFEREGRWPIPFPKRDSA